MMWDKKSVQSSCCGHTWLQLWHSPAGQLYICGSCLEQPFGLRVVTIFHTCKPNHRGKKRKLQSIHYIPPFSIFLFVIVVMVNDCCYCCYKFVWVGLLFRFVSMVNDTSFSTHVQGKKYSKKKRA